MKMQNFFRLLLVIFCMVFFVSRASAEHTPLHAPLGKWVANGEAKKAFEEGKVIPGYTYYYIGSVVEPDSVIALSKEYTLRDVKVWTKVLDMSDAVIRGWVQGWKTDGHQLSELNGGVILAPDGKKAGIWHSHYPAGTVRMPSPGILDVFQPHPSSTE